MAAAVRRRRGNGSGGGGAELLTREGSRGFSTTQICELTGETRANPDRTADAVSCTDPTARGLTGDVDPLPAPGMNPAFVL
jgi:hypothetical protein